MSAKTQPQGCNINCTSCQGQAIEVQNASATPRWPVVKKNIKDTCRWRGLFWLCLDQSTPIFFPALWQKSVTPNAQRPTRNAQRVTPNAQRVTLNAQRPTHHTRCRDVWHFLTLSRPVHADCSIWTFKHWRFFWNWLGLGQSTPIFFGLQHLNLF
jgi:hypothetical protein